MKKLNKILSIGLAAMLAISAMSMSIFANEINSNMNKDNEFDLYSATYQSNTVNCDVPYIKENGIVYIEVKNNGNQLIQVTIKDGDNEIGKNVIESQGEKTFEIHTTTFASGKFSVNAHSCENIGDSIDIYFKATQEILFFRVEEGPVQDAMFPINYASRWSVQDIDRSISLGYINENMQTEYTNPINRKDFCIILYNILNKNGSLEPVEQKYVFKDIFMTEIDSLVSVGIINGRTTDTFGAKDNITREEAATIVAKTVGYLQLPLIENNSFKYSDDISISQWAKNSVYTVKQLGIMEGINNNNFEPKGIYTKEQAIVTLMRLYDKATESKNI